MPINNEAIDIEEDEIPEGLDELLDETLTAMEIQDKFEDKEKAKKFVSKSFAAPSLRAKPKVKRAKIKSSKLLDKGPKDLQGVRSDEKLVGGINDNLTRVSESLGAIEQVLRQQFGLEKSETEKDARSAALEKAKEREEKLEGKKKVQKDRKSALKAITPPAIGFFDTLKNYFKNILIGGALLGIINWFKDPENQKKIDEFKTFVTENLGKIITGVAVAALAIVAIPIIPTLLSLTGLLLGGLPILAKMIGVFANPLGFKALLIALGVVGAAAIFRKVDEERRGGKIGADFDRALQQELKVGGLEFKNYTTLTGPKKRFRLLDEGGKPLEVPSYDQKDGTPGLLGPLPRYTKSTGKSKLFLDDEKARQYIVNNLGGYKRLAQLDAAAERYNTEMARKDKMIRERDAAMREARRKVIESRPAFSKPQNFGDYLKDLVGFREMTEEDKETKRLAEAAAEARAQVEREFLGESTTPPVAPPEQNMFLQNYDQFIENNRENYQELKRNIDRLNEFLQPPEKKSPEVSFLPIGAASQTPTSAASATQTNVAVFSATDSSAPYSMAVRSIYNMVNA